MDVDRLGVAAVSSVGSSSSLSELTRILLFFGLDFLGPVGVAVGLSIARFSVPVDFFPLPFPFACLASGVAFSGVASIGVDVARGGSDLFRFLVFLVSFASSCSNQSSRSDLRAFALSHLCAAS